MTGLADPSYSKLHNPTDNNYRDRDRYRDSSDSSRKFHKGQDLPLLFMLILSRPRLGLRVSNGGVV
jgi:hypothetical protein